MTLGDAEIDAMIRRETAPLSPPLVPELTLYGAADYAEIWSATEASLAAMALPPPFWAFAWAGGQALARFILDNPGAIQGRTVFAFGAGGGLEAIAAVKAGATRVTANDIDAVARRAMALNAALNGVAPGDAFLIDGADRLVSPTPPEADLILCGDVYYEREIADRLTPLLQAALDRGAEVWIGDAGRPYEPRENIERLAQYRVPTPRALEDVETRDASVLRLLPATAQHPSKSGS